MHDCRLYLRKVLPEGPSDIARQDSLAKLYSLKPVENLADHETGRPAFYGDTIVTDYSHSIGIPKRPELNAASRQTFRPLIPILSLNPKMGQSRNSKFRLLHLLII